MTQMVEVPLSLLKKVEETRDAIDALEAELEGFLISQNQRLLDRLQKARLEHLEGKLRRFGELENPK